MLQVRNRTSVSCAARRSPRAAIWSRTCVSTPVTSHFSAASATKRSRERSIYVGTGKVSTRRRRRLIIALCRYHRSSSSNNSNRQTATGTHQYHRTRHPPRVTMWYPCPAVAETCSSDRRFVRKRAPGSRTERYVSLNRNTAGPIRGGQYCEIGYQKRDFVDTLTPTWLDGVTHRAHMVCVYVSTSTYCWDNDTSSHSASLVRTNLVLLCEEVEYSKVRANPEKITFREIIFKVKQKKS